MSLLTRKSEAEDYIAGKGKKNGKERKIGFGFIRESIDNSMFREIRPESVAAGQIQEAACMLYSHFSLCDTTQLMMYECMN